MADSETFHDLMQTLRVSGYITNVTLISLAFISSFPIFYPNTVYSYQYIHEYDSKSPDVLLMPYMVLGSQVVCALNSVPKCSFWERFDLMWFGW